MAGIPLLMAFKKDDVLVKGTGVVISFPIGKKIGYGLNNNLKQRSKQIWYDQQLFRKYQNLNNGQWVEFLHRLELLFRRIPNLNWAVK